MANIKTHLNNIKGALYGKDVRNSIHDAIEQCYTDASINGNANMEVTQARGEYETLGERLDDHVSQLAHNVNGINVDLAWDIKQDINQTEIIQAKINEVSDNTVLNFTGKNYIINEIVLENKKNIKIVGYNSVIVTDNPLKNIFKIINCENITIEGFNIDCIWEKSDNSEQGHVIYCENSVNINIVYNNFNRSGISFLECSNINITNNTFTDSEQIIYYPILLRNVGGCTITNNNINGASVDGVKVSGTTENGNNSHSIIISHNIIKNCYYDAIDLFSGGYKAIVSNNVLSECEKGVHVKAWGGEEADYSAIEGYSKDIIIEGNQISNTNHQCVWIGCDNVLVDGNILTNSSYGVYVMEGKNGNKVKNVKIVNNIVKDMSYYAVETMADVENVIIQNNYIENITKFGLRIISSHNTIDNNVFINPGSRGITVSSPYDNNRVYVSNNKIISNNTLNFGIIISGKLHNSSSINNNIVDNASIPYQGAIKEGCNSWNNFIILNNKTIAKSIDLSSISVGTITTIELPFKMNIKKMSIDGIVSSSTKSFRGSYAKDEQVCLYVFGDSSFNNATQSYSICFADNTSNRLFGLIQNVNENSFEIKWDGTGNLTGTAFIKFDIEYY